MSQMLSIAKKELKAYFGSPMAAIFIGAFLLSALFSFFWMETFFARNIADIRPLFRWMPLLMIFLVGALTMRQWSEEQKMGTLEVLLTLPVRLHQLVLGKFLAVLSLVGVALALTFWLPITVSLMGNMDWGPVLGGYLGALLMASSYIAIGLFVSSRTDNQIIALIVSVLLAGLFYLAGSAGITSFMGNDAAELFRALGTGSRFASIERGVIDLRDLAYYGSLSAFFLLLNISSLDRQRWSFGANTAQYRRNAAIAMVLIAANLLALNVWLNRIDMLRVDLTENREYSISSSTRDLLANVTEPLLLRGYFSDKTHPLLAPLVPRIRDLMTEYGIASNGNVTVSFVDPKYDEELEAEANQQYGIKPVPFQVAGRYEASVVNSYFNILIKYGDQHVTLGFDDLIEIQPRKSGQLDVGLRNLEYDLTKSIKRVMYGFQSIGTVFENINQDLELIAVVTPSALPEPLAEMPKHIEKVAEALQKESGEKLRFQLIDPDTVANGREQVKTRYGVDPLAVSFFSGDTFYMHLLLKIGDDLERIYLGGDMGEAEIRKEVEATLKRTSSGFLKTVGLWTPKPDMPPSMPPMYQQPQENYRTFQEVLRENYNIEKVDLTDGRVPGDVDVLLLVAPQGMNDRERFAIDQYLMRGGAVVALAGNYLLDLSPYSESLRIKKAEEGIAELLRHYGINVDDALVMDRQNEPFPVPVERNLGGFTVREIQRLNYPFFVDVRNEGMDQASPVVANLPAVTMNWVSPVIVDPQKAGGRIVTTLLQSSPDSWLHTGTDIEPDFQRYAGEGFAVGDSLESKPLAVSVRGSFESFFKDKPDPRQSKDEEDIEEFGLDPEKQEAAASKEEEKKEEIPLEPLIDKSPESSRLVVVGSSEFINDSVIAISRSLGQDRFLNSLGFLQNSIDWSVEDEELLAIRSRGSHARLLAPMSREAQSFWEWLNYGLAIASLVLLSLFGAMRLKREKSIELV